MIIILSISLVAINNFNPTIINADSSDLGLVGYWSFDEGSGSIAYDSSSNGNHGTINGASWTSGISGNALMYDGIDDYVLVPDSDSISIGNQDLTISVWIKPLYNNTVNHVILSKVQGAHNKEYWLNFEPINKIRYGIENWYDDSNYVTTTTSPVILDSWQHIAVTFNADSFATEIYHNGIVQNSIGSIDELPQMLDDDLTIGIYGGIMKDGFDGLIDEIRIYNRALNPSEIYELYTNPDMMNDSPETPNIEGETSGKKGTSYIYSAVTTDPDNDDCYYWFDWGDGTNSGWVGPFDSGTDCSESHIWDAEGSYVIKAKAKDAYGAESSWSSSKTVTISTLESVITVSSPYSGDTWYQGGTNTIGWSSENAGSYVDIDLYQDGYFHSYIASFEYNDGSYLWAVPSGLSSSSYYEILIIDSYDSSIYGYSGFFYIGEPEPLGYITVISPSSGVTWNVGDVNTISWTADNVVGSYIDINLFQDGFPYSIIASYEYNDGSYSWTVPSGVSTSSYYEIRITDSSDGSVYGYSDSFYIDELLVSYITVSSPYSGDTWYQGDTSTISWSSYNAGDYVDIDLYEDGYFHSIIALSSYNDGSYSWTIPSGLNTDSYYEILITDSSDSSVYDYSGYLSIQKSPGLNFQEWIIIIAVFMVISLLIIIVVIVVRKGNPKELPKEYQNRDNEENLKLNKMKEKVKRWKKEGYNVDEIEQMIKSNKER